MSISKPTQEEVNEAAEMLGVDIIVYGEPMVCESHPWRLWPRKDEGCPGPGMPLSNAERWFVEQDPDAR